MLSFADIDFGSVTVVLVTHDSRAAAHAERLAACLLDRGGTVGGELDRMGIPFHPVLGAPDVGREYGS